MSFLQRAYNREDFLNFVNKDFLSDFSNDKRPVRTHEKSLLKEVQKLGDSVDLGLSVFEATCDESDHGKRVAITMDAFRILRDTATRNALIVFYSKDSDKWRLSLLTSSFELDGKGKVTSKMSNPRRYSYLLGEDAKTVTPRKYLEAKGTVKDFNDLQSRFAVEVVNNDFYKEIAKLYDELVGTDKMTGSLKYPGQGEVSHQFAVRLIGRIIFCWFLREKKSDKDTPLIPQKILSGDAAKDDNYYHNVLAPLFFEVLNKRVKSRSDKFREGHYESIPYLNGGLFSPDLDDHYKFDKTLQLSVPGLVDVPDKWLRALFDLLETYNFTVDENTTYDVELSIDPEMLGRIFENLLARINPETGETVRKMTGSFYTPREIVEYMVDESLKQYLKTKTNINDDKLSAIISYDLDDDENYPVNDTDKEKITDALSQVKILDPACGSGAFPIGILQKIVFILQQVDPDSKKWIEKQLVGASPEFRHHLEREYENENFNYLRKLGVIRESIYGVDIQPIATEISRLRCFLTLIVDQYVNDKDDNRGIEPLPNLDFKFVTANSLVKLESSTKKSQTGLFEDTSGIDELKRLRDEYFSSHNHERDSLKLQFSDRQNQMLQDMIASNSSGFSESTQKLSTWKPFSHSQTDWFDPEWMFGISAGFNIIIANPPYVRIHKQDSNKKELMKKIYKSAVGDYDMYILFFERGLDLLAEEGVLSYITPDKYLVREYGKVLRRIILSKKIIALIDISRAVDAFAASTYPLISIISNSEPADKIVIRTANSIKHISDIEQETEISHKKAQLDNIIEIIDPHDLKVIEKIYGHSVPLSSVFRSDQIFCGTPRAKDYKYWGTRVTNELSENASVVPLYVCASLSPYKINRHKVVRALGNRTTNPCFDNTNGAISGQRWKDFTHKPKILIRGNDTRITAALDTTGSVFVGVYAIKIESSNEPNYKSILAQLNSKMVNWVFKVQNPSVRIGGGYFSINAPQLVKLPIIPAGNLVNEVLTDLVNKIQNSSNPETDSSEIITTISNEIDKVIYDYYGLSDGEIEAIEASF